MYICSRVQNREMVRRKAVRERTQHDGSESPWERQRKGVGKKCQGCEDMRRKKLADGEHPLMPPYVCYQTGGLSNELRERDGERDMDVTHW